MRFQGRNLSARVILIAGMIGAALCSSAGWAAEVDSPWAHQARAASEDLAAGNWDRLASDAAALEALDPDDPLPTYLRARLAEHEGRWRDALDGYRRVIAQADEADGAAWEHLAAGRWVRVSRELNQSRVATVLAQSESVEARSGRCLVLPLEPIGRGPVDEEQDLEALGIAAAHWIIASLAQLEGAEPVDLPVALELRRALAPGARSAVRTPSAEAPLPPVTTILGVTSRLASLTPRHPAPGIGGETPAHYLLAAPTGEWTQLHAQALAHFQYEHDLPASGIPDPESRRSLEEAYQADLRRQIAAGPRRDLTDPTREMARLLGATSLLTGTVQEVEDGAIRWNVAWIAAADGSLIAPSLAGSLPREGFRIAWGHMLDHIMVSSQLCTPGTNCLPAQISPTLTRDGAQDYGRALLAVEEGEGSMAAGFFASAAANGAGQWAEWFAMAWRDDAQGLVALEHERFEREIFGPLLLAPGLLRAEGLILSGGLMGGRGAVEIPRDPGISYAPTTGWLRIEGRIVIP